MPNSKLESLLHKEMSRKDFLSFTALTIISIFGVAGVISELLSHAASPYASTESESGTLTGDAATIASTIASGAKAVQFGSIVSIVSLAPTSAYAGEKVTITGTNFGSSQGTNYITFIDGQTTWGEPTNAATFTVVSWSNTSIVFEVPTPSGTDDVWSVSSGDTATVQVTTSTGTSGILSLSIISGTTSTVPLVPANIRFGIAGDYSAGTRAGEGPLLDRVVDSYTDYAGWQTGTDAIPTPNFSGIGTADYVWTLQPAGTNAAQSTLSVNWPQLIAGDFDTQIITFANWINTQKSSGALQGRFYVRFAHEMNQDPASWYAWQIGGSCGVTTPAMYAEGFNHFASVLKAHCSYVELIWCVNVNNTPPAPYYPSECDIMSMDGYNNIGGNWQSDSAVFLSTYQQLLAIDSSKPIHISEMGCTEQSGQSKASWVTTFMNSTSYPNLQSWTWFDFDQGTGAEWQFNSSTTSLAAFQSGFQNSRTGAAYFNSGA
jgi:hypothetical protein